MTVCAGITLVALVSALFAMDRSARWSIAVPVLPALLLWMATVRGREKSWYGEVAAGVAFGGLAVPLSIAGGASVTTAAATAVPFVLLFVTSTLAVRIVVLRIRGGGDPRATAATRMSAFAFTGAAVMCLGWLTAIDALPGAASMAAAPGLATALVIAARPPRPTHLRRIGWTLVGVSVLTAAIAVATL